MTISTSSNLPTSNTLSYQKITQYWLPLAASWLLMGSEGPILNSVISRLSDANLMIAAYGIVLAIGITIESPVISLLSTSTALARNRQHYLMLRRFTGHLMLITTIIHILMGWTPLFDIVVVQWLKVPAELNQPILLGMRAMLFWSAAIGYRRFIQGILIRYGKTRYVSRGTLLRLMSAAGTALSLSFFTDLPGILVGALGLNTGVLIEAIYAYWVSRDLIKQEFGTNPPEAQSTETLTYLDLVNFHWPLAASILLFMLARPMITAALSRSPNALIDLAAWPILSGLLFLLRSPAVALPEVIIALSDDEDQSNKLGKFSLFIGISLSSIMAIFAFTSLGTSYFENIIGVESEVAAIAQQGAQYAFLLPLIMAGLSYYRGKLTAAKNTLPITIAMGVELALMAGLLFLGVKIDAPGVIFAAITMTLAMSGDILTLWVGAKRSLQNK